jgi:1-acyl-sn-glycerol-3-phosphate acyltransferase
MEADMARTIFTTPILSSLLRGFSSIFLKVTGWKVEGYSYIQIKKSVIVAAPHTSNWDLPNMLMVALVLRCNVCWMGKKSLFSFPFGWLMRWLGGIPIDRNTSNNNVEVSVEAIQLAPGEFHLAIAPEGTRGKVTKWKSGFYYIALGAKVPILLAYLDYSSKKGGIRHAFYPTGDIAKDMPKIKAFYSSFEGKNPTQFHK